ERLVVGHGFVLTPAAAERERKSDGPPNHRKAPRYPLLPFTLLRFRPWPPRRNRLEVNRLAGWRIRGPAGPIFVPAPPHNATLAGTSAGDEKGERPVWPEFQIEAQALPARLRLASRFDGLPDRALAARIF